MRKSGISISDMMTGLMMVFLFLSILFIDKAQKESEQRILTSTKSIEETKKSVQKIEDITQRYKRDKIKIGDRLDKEFQKDLQKWQAEFIKTSLVIRFLSPDIMFNPGKSVIKTEFKNILNDFCPRYFNILFEYKQDIEEIRIEGHTSSEWEGSSTESAYFKNMELSQDRSRSVLVYCLTIKNMEKNIKNWVREKLTANGLSSSRPICLKDTQRCYHKNRRVEFRIQTNESIVLDKVIKELENIFPSKLSPTDKIREGE